MSDKLLVEYHDHTAVITINNPPANTWDMESVTALTELIPQLNDNRNVYSLVITGQGGKFFSAGADLKNFIEGDTAKARELIEMFAKAFESLSSFRGVSIAALNGYTMGGGMECALACDIRIAEEQIILALPEARVGLLPGAGGTQRVQALAGEGWAKLMMLCGEQLTANKALEIGLVEKLVERGGAMAAALALAENVARQSPSSVAACKSLIQESRAVIENGLKQEREKFSALFETQDRQEGVSAFLEKRTPEWKNV